MKNILNRGFARVPLPDFVSLVLVIIDRLTGNPNFPTTDPTVSAVSAQLGVLQNAMLIADPVALETAIAAARPVLEQMLDDLADNLEKTVNMDPVKLATTGFPMHKATEQTSAPPDTPQNGRARRTDQAGQVQLLPSRWIGRGATKCRYRPRPRRGRLRPTTRLARRGRCS
jgi:hypothetical protein